jgi:hypothetical protein
MVEQLNGSDRTSEMILHVGRKMVCVHEVCSLFLMIQLTISVPLRVPNPAAAFHAGKRHITYVKDSWGCSCASSPIDIKSVDSGLQIPSNLSISPALGRSAVKA